MSDYIALIHKDLDSDYGVSFPDFPGCVTAGSTIDEAKDMAKEALAGHVQTMIDYGDKIPEPSRLESIMADPENADVIAFLVVTVPDPNPKSVRVNITVPENTLRQIDAAAKKRGMSRSSFLVHAAKNSLHGE
ncbi:MAG: type II toxin-antitoxin system HicB family antitoxin [Thermodesulfobacteriota bacterium]|nr:type II toxin-antitoxin system HicB family antitoxin [Thermodesulfobacteriota bacterium]